MLAPLQPHHCTEKVGPESPPGGDVLFTSPVLGCPAPQHNSLWKLWGVWDVSVFYSRRKNGRQQASSRRALCEEGVHKEGKVLASCLPSEPPWDHPGHSTWLWWWPLCCLVCGFAMLCTSLSLTWSPPFSTSWNAVWMSCLNHFWECSPHLLAFNPTPRMSTGSASPAWLFILLQSRVGKWLLFFTPPSHKTSAVWLTVIQCGTISIWSNGFSALVRW